MPGPTSKYGCTLAPASNGHAGGAAHTPRLAMKATTPPSRKRTAERTSPAPPSGSNVAPRSPSSSKISDIALARLRGTRARNAPPAADAFKPAVHPPGVGRNGGPPMALDDAGWGTGLSWARGQVGAILEEGQAFLGYAHLSLLAQRGEHRRIVEIVATEMTRKWIRLTAKGDEDKTEEIDQLNDELDRLQVRDAFRRLAEGDGYFGRSHLYLDTGDGDDPEEMLADIGDASPGNDTSPTKVNPQHPLRAVRVVEAMWCYPASYNTNDPLRADWYQPQEWIVMAKHIHASRLLRFVGREVPDMLKPAYSFGGIPLTQMAKPYVDNWLRTRQSVSDLVHSYSIFTLSTDMSALMGADGQEVFNRVDLFNLLRDNKSIMLVSNETNNKEELSNVSVNLAVLDELQAQALEQICSITGIPLVKYTGISPHGLNATSEGELRSFEDWTHSYQEKLFRSQLTTVLHFVMLSRWGKIDTDISFEFEPLRSMDDKEIAEVRKIEAETDGVLIDKGVLHPEESRKRVAADPDTPYASLDIEDVPDLAQEELEGLMPGKGGEGGHTGGEGEGEGGEGEAADEGIIPFAVDSEWNEADHPRGQPGNAGQFGSGGTGSGGTSTEAREADRTEGGGPRATAASLDPDKPVFQSKKEHAAHLLSKGTTAKDLMTALGWPSISMPAMAKSLGMNLTKVKEGKVTKYTGTPMTPEERKRANLMPPGVRRSGGPAARDQATWSLMEFIASKGGIKASDPLTADLRSMFGGKTANKFVPGFGTIIRPNGLSLDRMREAAVEAGYLFDPGEHSEGLRTTSINTLLEAIDREHGGNKVYRNDVEPEHVRTAREEEAREREDAEIHSAINRAVSQYGLPELTDRQYDRVYQLITKEGIRDPIEAIEREAMEWVTDASERGEAERILDDIPGWDVPADPEPAPRAGGAAVPF